MMPQSGKKYVIINVASNTALDLPWEAKQLTGYAIHRQNNQQVCLVLLVSHALLIDRMAVDTGGALQ